MKILAIRIKNLASLEGITEIDFTAEPLCSAGIFAITGTTGAGKSTILDALCLALYGQTPRYQQAREIGIEIHDVQGSKIRQGDVRGILRDGTSEGYAEVDFAGIDGQRYRATWSVRRARNKVDGSMQSDSIVLKNLSTNTDLPGKKHETLSEIARVVGLNFEQFTRSVLLAQGDFTAFMKASKDEKSSLLEKLTGTHIYSEISRKVFESCRNEEQQLRELKLRVEGIATLTDEEALLLKEEAAQLHIQIGEKEKQLEAIDKAIHWHLQYEQHFKALEEASLALKQAQATREDARSRKQHLFLVEQVQQTRSWSDALQLANQQYNTKKEAYEQARLNLSILQTQESDCSEKLKLADDALKIKAAQVEASVPLLSQARKLDTLLIEKINQLKAIQNEYLLASAKRNEHVQLLNETNNKVASLDNEIRKFRDWKAEHQDRQAIAENSDLILSKLEDAGQYRARQLEAENEISNLNHIITGFIGSRTKIADKISTVENQTHKLQKEFDRLSKEILLIPIEQLSLEKDQADADIQQITSALAHWKQLHSGQNALNNLQAELLEKQQDSVAKEFQLSATNGKVLTLQAKRDTTRQLFKQSQLAAAENVETLRSGLEPDLPCPVCGSTTHPYASESPALHSILAGLEQALKDSEQAYLDAYGTFKALEQDCKNVKNTLVKLAEDIPVLSSEVLLMQDQWHKFPVSQTLEAVSPESRTQALEENLRAHKDRQAALQLSVHQHAKLRSEVEKGRLELESQKANRDELNRQFQDILQSQALSTEKLNAKVSEQQQIAGALKQIFEILKVYFTNPDWIEKWEAQPVVFADRIREFTRSWKESEKKLEENLQQKQLLDSSLAAMLSTANELTEDTNRKSAMVLEQEKLVTTLKQQRKALFGGTAADEIESLMKSALNQLQAELKDFENQQQRLAIDCAKEIARRDALTGELTKLEQAINDSVIKIDAWLQHFNTKHQTTLDRVQLSELLSHHDAWITSEKHAMQSIDEEVTKADSVLTERQKLLANHRESQISHKAVGVLEQEKSAIKEELNAQKVMTNEIDFRFKQDTANKNMIGGLLQEISRQQLITDNYSRLNDIIGSADGKKFRQIAQEYTLDVLLGYANVHLQMLTKRYRIERIPGSLGLQVVDQDMGDEVRTVYSLSGGESFLVSLALALGLASLSSSRMQVESLFIDEGFGSLDPVTLNIAMDALERLHNQGRKVGVISHVQEMTERIPVQIKVSKMSSGKSKVEVL